MNHIGQFLEEWGARLQWLALRHVSFASHPLAWRLIIVALAAGNLLARAGYRMVEHSALT